MHITSGEETGLMKHSTMAQLGASFSVKKAVNWFDLLLASLDCYTWVFGQGLLSPAAMLGKLGVVTIQDFLSVNVIFFDCCIHICG